MFLVMGVMVDLLFETYVAFLNVEGETNGAVIWKIPELYGQSNSPPLEQLVSFDGHPCKIRR